MGRRTVQLERTVWLGSVNMNVFKEKEESHGVWNLVYSHSGLPGQAEMWFYLGLQWGHSILFAEAMEG